MKKQLTSLTGMLIILAVSLAFSQNMPFPQAKNWSDCIKPTNVSQAQMNKDIINLYEYWKASFLKTSQNTTGGYYIYTKGTGTVDDCITVSEAHGWGMIIFALMAGYDDQAQELFDGMYWFYDDHRSATNDNLMEWDIVSGETSISHGSATDGDMDIAYGLILASKQWGGTDPDYLQAAKDLITQGLEVSCVNKSTNLIMFGDWWDNGMGHENNSRPSDWMTGHLHAYAEITGTGYWNTLATNLYTRISNFTSSHSPTTGLLSDFYVNGSPPSGKFLETENDGFYYWNACRIPWRIAMDYGHYGTSSAKTVCNKMVNWLKTKTSNTPSDIAVGYKLDGTPLDASINSVGFIAPFMCASVVDAAHQNYLNKGWNEMRSEPLDIEEYETTINLLSMLFISGNWWKPGDSNTPFQEPTISEKGVLFDDFENYYGDDGDQSFLGAAYGYFMVEDPAPGGSFWYAFYDSGGSKIENGDGMLIGETNAKDMVKDNQLHIKMTTSTSTTQYPYAGIGCAILKTGNEFFNFSSMDGLTIRAKGSGTVRVEFVTRDIWDLVPADDRWGYHGVDIELTGSYKDYKISTHYFTPQRYSPLDLEGYGWLDKGKSGVREIFISVLDSASDVEIYIDSIFFNGMDYQNDFGFEPGPTNVHPSSFANLHNGKVVHNAITKTLTVTYRLKQNGPVTLGIIDCKGQQIMKPATLLQQKGINTYTVDLGKLNVSSGVYFITVHVDKKQFRHKFCLTK